VGNGKTTCGLTNLAMDRKTNMKAKQFEINRIDLTFGRKQQKPTQKSFLRYSCCSHKKTGECARKRLDASLDIPSQYFEFPAIALKTTGSIRN